MAYDQRKWVAQSLAHRRRRPWTPWLIGLGIVVALLWAVVTLLHPEGSRTGDGILAFLLPVTFATLASPFARESWLTGKGLATFDEFERDALRRASQRAYSVLLLLVVLLFVWWWVASLAGWAIPARPASWLTLGFAVAGIGAALPILFAEIMVPIPPADDADEDSL